MVKLVVAASKESLGNAVAHELARLAGEAVSQRGKFTVALSGGSMPKLLEGLSEEPDVEWSKWQVFFSDERHVPLTSDDSNYKACKDALFDKVPLPAENVHAISASLPLEECREDYKTQLDAVFGEGTGTATQADKLPVFDAVLLGMGPDGHTASLFPEHALSAEVGRGEDGCCECESVSLIRDSPKPPPERLTLSLAALCRARHVMFIAAGAAKAEVLKTLFTAAPSNKKREDEGDSCLADGGGEGLVVVKGSPYPAGLVYPVSCNTEGALSWYVDSAAAADCSAEVLAAAVMLE